MRFEIIPRQIEREFIIVYRRTDRALESVPKPSSSGYASLSFNEVQLELSEAGFVNSVWGYCPAESWEVSQLKPPTANPSELRVIANSELVPGTSVRMSEKRLPVRHDSNSNWLCLGDSGGSEDFQVQIAPPLIVVGNPNELIALWIQIARFE